MFFKSFIIILKISFFVILNVLFFVFVYVLIINPTWYIFNPGPKKQKVFVDVQRVSEGFDVKFLPYLSGIFKMNME